MKEGSGFEVGTRAWRGREGELQGSARGTRERARAALSWCSVVLVGGLVPQKRRQRGGLPGAQRHKAGTGRGGARPLAALTRPLIREIPSAVPGA